MGYPSSIATLPQPNSSTAMDDPTFEHDSVHANVAAEVMAIETELGVSPSTISEAVTATSTPSSVANYLDMVATQLKAIIGGSHWYSTFTNSLAALANVTGNVVGDSDTQTLTNKTLTAPVIRAYLGWQDANETWTYASWDSTNKTGTITVPTNATTKYSAGMKIKITQATGGVKYGIITVVAATLLTVYFGTDYTLTNETISTPFYSLMKDPFGFPLNPDKWTVSVTDSTQRFSAGIADNTWTNVGTTNSQITIPIGLWNVSYYVSLANANAGSITGMISTLSTASNSESDTEFSCYAFKQSNNFNTVSQSGFGARSKILSLSAATLYYLNAKASTGGNVSTLYFENAIAPMLIKAVCAYL